MPFPHLRLCDGVGVCFALTSIVSALKSQDVGFCVRKVHVADKKAKRKRSVTGKVSEVKLPLNQTVTFKHAQVIVCVCACALPQPSAPYHIIQTSNNSKTSGETIT